MKQQQHGTTVSVAQNHVRFRCQYDFFHRHTAVHFLRQDNLNVHYTRLTTFAPHHCFQLKSEHDLDALKKLPIANLILDGNPLCDKFKDDTTYVR